MGKFTSEGAGHEVCVARRTFWEQERIEISEVETLANHRDARSFRLRTPGHGVRARHAQTGTVTSGGRGSRKQHFRLEGTA